MIDIFYFNEKALKRHENNAWRVVAWDALRSTAGMVAHSKLSNEKVKKFNFSSKRRIESRRTQRKARQRAWLTSLYTGNGDESDVSDLVEWAEKLDFEEYHTKWASLITLPK